MKRNTAGLEGQICSLSVSGVPFQAFKKFVKGALYND